LENTAYILLGGNQGNREKLLGQAIQLIKTNLGQIIKCSGLYESDAWGYKSESKFLNQVIQITTVFPPNQLLSELKKIESQLGRTRTEEKGYEDRSLDLDILFYNELIINKRELIIPHPRMHLRRFTLKPLAEIAGSVIHPYFKVSVENLLNNCNDQVEVYDYFPPVNQEYSGDEI